MSDRRMAALRQDSRESNSEDGQTTHRSLAGSIIVIDNRLLVIHWYSSLDLVLFPCLFSDCSASEASACDNQAVPIQMKNYYKSVSENKEIIKLVTVLSTSINSSKKVTAMLIKA